MPKVLTLCPRTFAVVPTNLTMDLGTFGAIRFGGFTLQCPACGDHHEWGQEESWVAGSPRRDAGLSRAPAVGA